MDTEGKGHKINITSTVAEKGLEIATQFLNKLITPAIEEVGLLVKDKITIWRFSNQVKMLNKAKNICTKNNISTKAISLKILVPLLENASLEEDEGLMDKWAILLSNLVDSEKNITNHVFPYILGQISLTEFTSLEQNCIEKKQQIKQVKNQLYQILKDKSNIISQLKTNISLLTEEIEELKKTLRPYSPEIINLNTERYNYQHELNTVDHQEYHLQHEIEKKQIITPDELKEFEVSNLIRLGLIESVQESEASTSQIEIPNSTHSYEEYTTVDIDVEINSENYHVVTELGHLFISSCTLKDEYEN